VVLDGLGGVIKLESATPGRGVNGGPGRITAYIPVGCQRLASLMKNRSIRFFQTFDLPIEATALTLHYRASLQAHEQIDGKLESHGGQVLHFTFNFTVSIPAQPERAG